MALFGLLGLITLTILAFFNIETAPPVWWDEGWTLALARNWSEAGMYGQLKLGDPRSPGLAGALPLVAPIALSFRLFGAGIWQGRIVGLLFTVAALLFTYLVARQLWSRKIAYGAVVSILILLPHPLLNPLLVGRQILGDVPVVVFLLAGYFFLFRAYELSAWNGLATIFFWGLALVTKGQALPFWSVGILLPVVLGIYQKNWRRALSFAAIAAASWVTAAGIYRFQASLLTEGARPLGALPGLLAIVAVVPDLHIRMAALQLAVIFGLPVLIGLLVGLAQLAAVLRSGARLETRQWILASLLALTGSWFAWYVLLSNGGVRYMASPLILGGALTAAGLYQTTNGFHLGETVRSAAASLRIPSTRPRALVGLFSVILALLLTVATVLVVFSSLQTVDNSVANVSDYLHAVSPPGSVVETYESELFVFLDRPYHYPPDQLHVEYLRRFLLEPDLEVSYDALSADPDYLVVGPIGEAWHVYDAALRSDEFRLMQEFNRYKVYERIR